MVKARLLLAVSIVAVISVRMGVAQTPRPVFEVASIKPNTSVEPSGGSEFAAGRFTGKDVTAKRVIGLAFQPLLGNQIVGGPAWLDTDRFDIQAKASGDPSAAQLRLMLQSLLEERFKLVTHRETRELPVYNLVMARGDGKAGARLRPSQTNCVNDRPPTPVSQVTIPQCAFTFTDTALRGKGVTMRALARELSFVGRVVLDKTDLAGQFDVDLEWASVPSGPDVPADAGPSIFTTLQEQLGLKLESTKGPVDVLVIDHVEHPTED
jgi:uncharacterized protein (TIGR03435 family)